MLEPVPTPLGLFTLIRTTKIIAIICYGPEKLLMLLLLLLYMANKRVLYKTWKQGANHNDNEAFDALREVYIGDWPGRQKHRQELSPFSQQHHVSLRGTVALWFFLSSVVFDVYHPCFALRTSSWDFSAFALLIFLLLPPLDYAACHVSTGVCVLVLLPARALMLACIALSFVLVFSHYGLWPVLAASLNLSKHAKPFEPTISFT